MIFEISAIVATVAFTLLVIFLIWVLITLKHTLLQTNEMVKNLNMKVEVISSQSVELIKNLNFLTENLQDQIHNLDPLMESVENIGNAVKGLTDSLNEEPVELIEEPKEVTWQDLVVEGIGVAAAAATIWKDVRKSKRACRKPIK